VKEFLYAFSILALGKCSVLIHYERRWVGPRAGLEDLAKEQYLFLRATDQDYRLYDETDLVTPIRMTRLRWAGHVVRMKDNLPCKKITLDKPEGRRRVGRPNLRWMDGWSDEGCREVGSQKLEDQGQGQRWLEAITRVGHDPA
jgi:hypothetical protein